MILKTESLTKTFEVGFRRRRVNAVVDLDLSVTEGEIFGFIGPNGAGKTTTIKMLMGLIHPTRGRAFIFDAPIPSRDARRRIGYLPENPSYYEFLTGLEVLEFLATLAEVPAATRRRRCEELLGLVGLSDAASRQVRKYSKGMQQRLGIAQALVSEPALVILDEPMSGLDPVGRRDVRDLMIELKRRGKTVFFSTHILPDVEALCDRVGVIVDGRMNDVGRLGDLLAARTKRVELTVLAPQAARSALSGGRVVAEEGDRIAVAYDDEEEADAAVRAVITAGGRVVSLNPQRESLEAFLMRRLKEDRQRC